jgi:hypothetical protein
MLTRARIGVCQPSKASFLEEFSVSDETRAVDAYKVYSDSRIRFDYFVTGGAGVVLAFSLKEFVPASGPLAAWLLPVAWALLLVALGAGLTGLNSFVEVMRLGVEYHRHRDEQGAIRSALLSGRTGTSVEVHTGRPITPQTAPALLTRLAEAEQRAARRSDREASLEVWAVHVRNISLVTALGVIGLWRWINL